MRGKHPANPAQCNYRSGGKHARRFPQFHSVPRFSEALLPEIFWPALRAEGSSASRRIYDIESRCCPTQWPVRVLASMGCLLSRGCPKGPIHFLSPQFLCSTWSARFFVPTHTDTEPARGEAVKDRKLAEVGEIGRAAGRDDAGLEPQRARAFSRFLEEAL